MAVSVTAGIQSLVTTAATSFTTVATPGVPGRLMVICFQHNQAAATVADATSITGGGLSSVTKILTKPFDTIAAATKKLEVWAGITSTTAAAIVVNFAASQTGSVWYVAEVVGADISKGTLGIVQTVSNSTDTAGNAISVSFGAFASPTNGALAVFGANAGLDSTSGSGWNRLGDTANSTVGLHSALQWRNTTPTVGDWTIAAGATARWAAIGLEIAASTKPWPQTIRYVTV